MACKDRYLYYSTDYCPNGNVYCPCVFLTVLMPQTSRTRVVSFMNTARYLVFYPPCTILAVCMCSWCGVRVAAMWRPCGNPDAGDDPCRGFAEVSREHVMWSCDLTRRVWASNPGDFVTVLMYSFCRAKLA